MKILIQFVFVSVKIMQQFKIVIVKILLQFIFVYVKIMQQYIIVIVKIWLQFIFVRKRNSYKLYMFNVKKKCYNLYFLE